MALSSCRFHQCQAMTLAYALLLAATTRSVGPLLCAPHPGVHGVYCSPTNKFIIICPTLISELWPLFYTGRSSERYSSTFHLSCQGIHFSRMPWGWTVRVGACQCPRCRWYPVPENLLTAISDSCSTGVYTASAQHELACRLRWRTWNICPILLVSNTHNDVRSTYICTICCHNFTLCNSYCKSFHWSTLGCDTATASHLCAGHYIGCCSMSKQSCHSVPSAGR